MREAGQIENTSSTELGFKISGLRWVIVGMIFLATLINYIDRLTVTTLAPKITEDLRLTNTQFGEIATWFLLAYTISQALSGKLYDGIGIKRGFTVSIIVWSLAAISHAWSVGLRSLSACRFMLGLGEAGNWPGAAKTVTEWFPARQRAFAMAIFNSGAALGSVVAPPLIVGLYGWFGHWQPVFVVTGLLGFAWLAVWWLVYDKPETHKWLSKTEFAIIKEGESESNGAGERQLGWLELLKYRQTWALVVPRVLVDPIWWLYITWLPLFLYQVHGFDLKQIGYFAWVPYVAADAGSLFGGWLTGFLIGRGWTVNAARKSVIAFAGLLMSAGIGAAYTSNPMAALALIGVVLFGFQAWINNVQTLPSDLFPTKAVGTVAGLGGMGAGIGSMIFVLSTGWVVDNFSYTPVLVTASVLAPLGTLVLFALVGNVRKLPIQQQAT
jgi:ACS family hexuronate transporter-like MFS transporter